MAELAELNPGDRVRYIGQRVKYGGVTGTVIRSQGFTSRGLIVSFFVKFDSGNGGVFSHPGDFVVLSAVERLADLARDGAP